MIRELKRRTADGRPYVRSQAVEATLRALSVLEDGMIARICRDGCFEGRRLASECLVHLARSAASEGSRSIFEAAYGTLEARLRRTLPGGARGDRPVSWADLSVRDAVLDRIRGMLAADAAEGGEALDFFEVRFDAAVASVRLDARRSMVRESRRRAPLLGDDGAMLEAVERAAWDRHADQRGCDAEREYRMSALADALSALPPLQRRIVELLMSGVPIHSKDGSARTVTKELRRSDRSVRTHRDRAFATIRRRREALGRDRRCCSDDAGLRRRG